MKLTRIGVFAFFNLLIVLGGSAFAANRGAMHVISEVDVSGKKIPPGNYTVEWDGSGNSVELQIKNGRKVVATASAKVVTLTKPFGEDSILVSANDGVRRLWQIRFSGKTYVLEIVGVSGAAPETEKWKPYSLDVNYAAAMETDRQQLVPLGEGA